MGGPNWTGQGHRPGPGGSHTVREEEAPCHNRELLYETTHTRPGGWPSGPPRPPPGSRGKDRVVPDHQGDAEWIPITFDHTTGRTRGVAKLQGALDNHPGTPVPSTGHGSSPPPQLDEAWLRVLRHHPTERIRRSRALMLGRAGLTPTPARPCSRRHSDLWRLRKNPERLPLHQMRPRRRPIQTWTVRTLLPQRRPRGAARRRHRGRQLGPAPSVRGDLRSAASPKRPYLAAQPRGQRPADRPGPGNPAAHAGHIQRPSRRADRHAHTRTL